MDDLIYKAIAMFPRCLTQGSFPSHCGMKCPHAWPCEGYRWPLENLRPLILTFPETDRTRRILAGIACCLDGENGSLCPQCPYYADCNTEDMMYLFYDIKDELTAAGFVLEEYHEES